MKKREIFFAAAVVLLLGFLLCGCMTQKKAIRYMSSHGYVAAQYCAAAFPIKSDSIFLPGKVIHTSDTTWLPGDSVQCPPGEPGKAGPKLPCPKPFAVHDTLWRHDTLRITKENPAKDSIISGLKDRLTLTTTRAENAENGRSKWRSWVLWTWGILAAVAAVIIVFKSQTAWFTNIIKRVTGGRF